MHFIHKNHRILRIQFRLQRTIVFLYFQTESIHHSINQLMCVNFLFLKCHTLPFKHRHLQHLFYLKTQTLRFVIDNS